LICVDTIMVPHLKC